MDWWSDLRTDFPQLDADEGRKLFVTLREAMGDPGEAFVHKVEIPREEGMTALMVVDDEDTRLISYANDVTNVEFLGSLAGASVSERITLISGGWQVDLSLRHEKLGSKELRVSRQAVSPHPGVPPRFGELGDARWDDLRTRFRDWASSSLPPEQPSDDGP